VAVVGPCRPPVARCPGGQPHRRRSLLLLLLSRDGRRRRHEPPSLATRQPAAAHFVPGLRARGGLAMPAGAPPRAGVHRRPTATPPRASPSAGGGRRRRRARAVAASPAPGRWAGSPPRPLSPGLPSRRPTTCVISLFFVRRHQRQRRVNGQTSPDGSLPARAHAAGGAPRPARARCRVCSGRAGGWRERGVRRVAAARVSMATLQHGAANRKRERKRKSSPEAPRSVARP
jgi:hypothetical protein